MLLDIQHARDRHRITPHLLCSIRAHVRTDSRPRLRHRADKDRPKLMDAVRILAQDLHRRLFILIDPIELLQAGLDHLPHGLPDAPDREIASLKGVLQDPVKNVAVHQGLGGLADGSNLGLQDRATEALIAIGDGCAGDQPVRMDNDEIFLLIDRDFGPVGSQWDMDHVADRDRRLEPLVS